MQLLKDNRKALIFLGVFVGLYLALNTLYGLYVNSYLPGADPITQIVSRQTAFFLNLIYGGVNDQPVAGSKYVPLILDDQVVVHVFEGCNSVNVMIVFFTFLVAFRGPIKSFVFFSLIGLLVIYAINLIRVGLLFWVALKFPEQLYFFHKFLFTGIIYLVVFAMWFIWVRHVGRGVGG